jgi:hypothetical protein
MRDYIFETEKPTILKCLRDMYLSEMLTGLLRRKLSDYE